VDHSPVPRGLLSALRYAYESLSHPGHSGTVKQKELHSSVENRKLRKQLRLNDFRSVAAGDARRALPSHGRGPRFDPLCAHHFQAAARAVTRSSESRSPDCPNRRRLRPPSRSGTSRPEIRTRSTRPSDRLHPPRRCGRSARDHRPG
jgi:hypothetical protein